MTPAEKAKELIDRFYRFADGTRMEQVWGDVEYSRDSSLRRNNAKQCALMHCDEMIESLKPIETNADKAIVGLIAFYKAVKLILLSNN